jgi:hypothetical protein
MGSQDMARRKPGAFAWIRKHATSAA